MASLGGRRNPRGVAFGAVPDERGLAPPDTATTRPGDRTDGDGSSDWITLTALAAAATVPEAAAATAAAKNGLLARLLNLPVSVRPARGIVARGSSAERVCVRAPRIV